MTTKTPGDDDLVLAFNQLTSATREFTAVVRSLKTRSVWVLALLVVTVLGLAGIGYAGWRLYDCTTPGGTCYRQGQERTGEAIAELVRADVLSDVRVGECVTASDGDLGRFRECVAAAGLVPAPPPRPSKPGPNREPYNRRTG